MNIKKTLIADFRLLRSGVPGSRFRTYVNKRRKRRGGHLSATRVFNFLGGVALIAVGLGIGWLPGPGGFLAIIGLAFIAQELPFIADFLDRVEGLVRKIVHSVKRYFEPPRDGTRSRVN